MVNWEDIHRRLARIRDIQDRGGVVDEGDEKRILTDRARRLASKPAEPPISGEQIQILEFTLTRDGQTSEAAGGISEKYGVETSYVREVAPTRALTAIPCTPAFIGGTVTLRAQIIAVLDLRPLFDLAMDEAGPLDRIIVLGTEEAPVGLLAAQIIGVRHVPISELEAALPTLVGARGKYMKGIDASRTAILDAGRLLSDPDIVVQSEA